MRRGKMLKNCLWGVTLLAVMVATISAATEKMDEKKNDHVWEPKTRSVTIFKNGLGFFIREGEVTLRDGWCLADQVPPATFGTLMIYAHGEKEAVDIVGSGPGQTIVFDGHDYAKDDATKRKELHKLEQLELNLTYLHKGETQTAQGKLVSVGSEFAILDSKSGNSAVSVESITKLQVLNLPLRVHVARGEKKAEKPGKDEAKKDEAKAGKNDWKTTLGVAYLRKGITWIPEYTLRVIDDETAELTLRGTIVNQAEDLIHSDVHLVVGVPHFVHTDKLAPLAIGQVLRAIGAAVVPQQLQGQMMNQAAMVQQCAPNLSNCVYPSISSPYSQPGMPPSTPAVPDVSTESLDDVIGNLQQMNTAAATDYTTYTQKDLTLRSGEKAIVTLFTKKIKYEHIYRWSTTGRMKHSLVLQNATDSAWTTGSCLAVSDQRPLSEDILKYIPRGASGELPITEAINIATDRNEQETDRKMKAYTPRANDPYDLVTLTGTITLRNFENREANVVVTCPVPGKPIEASDEGEAAIDSAQLNLTARNGRIVWNLKLAPGEKKTVTYTYERYVKAYYDGSGSYYPSPSEPMPEVSRSYEPSYSTVPVNRPSSKSVE